MWIGGFFMQKTILDIIQIKYYNQFNNLTINGCK